MTLRTMLLALLCAPMVAAAQSPETLFNLTRTAWCAMP